jgi:drug/metabolite transporter (DMT)-like permease
MRTRPTKVIGVVLLLAGIAVTLWSTLGYEERAHEADIGPLEIEVVERERPPVPVWLGLTLAAAGALLVFLPRRRS